MASDRTLRPSATFCKFPLWDRNSRILVLFLLGHLAVWTALPLLLQPNLPLDTIEMYSWGQELELGYSKHPPLPAWIAYAVAILTGHAAWGVYLVVQMSVVVCFWAAWRLGREMLPARFAFLGAVLLECCYYYNYEALDLNNNTVLYPFWALAVLTLYWGITKDRLPYWIATGALLGLAMLSKYSAAVLAVNMLLFGLLHPDMRRLWRTPGPYLAVLAGLAVFSPHLWWAAEQGFPSIRYAMERTGGHGLWFGRIVFPLEFAGAQVLALLAPFIVLTPLAGWRPRLRARAPSEQFNRDFLLAMVLGPLLLHLIISAVLNVRLKSMYGSHLWTFAGLAMVFFWTIHESPQRWRKTWVGCGIAAAVMASVLAVKSLAGPSFGVVHRIHFPGRALAAEVESLWRIHDASPLPTVGGEGWLAGNAAYYGNWHPTVYAIDVWPESSDAAEACAWMDDEQFVRQGGILLWDAADHPTMPPLLRRRFPRPAAVAVVQIRPHTYAGVEPLQIGAAVYRPVR